MGSRQIRIDDYGIALFLLPCDEGDEENIHPCMLFVETRPPAGLRFRCVYAWIFLMLLLAEALYARRLLCMVHIRW
jgi:hypothetical protein